MPGFADAYLQKAAIRGPLIELDPHPRLHLIVTIPVYHESGLERCLDSLFMRPIPGSFRAEVLILINAPASAPRNVLEYNQETLTRARNWIRRHPHPSIEFHPVLDHSFARRHAGVGTARKILMDEAVRRFNRVGNPEGIIASLDADAVVEPNYLEALLDHFGNPQPWVEGCSVYFEHPLSLEEGIECGLWDWDTAQEELTPGIVEAISRYELHLRYYVQAVRSTGYPYAFHTVGSAFAVRAEVYCKEGGMNRRQGGEDFYFIQKVAQRGHFSDCVTTRVIPSPRPSDRVPFGTGQVVRRLTREGEVMRSYDPELFRMLQVFFEGMEKGFISADSGDWIASQPPVLKEFLDAQKFDGALQEIRSNSASYPAFMKRFWRWFNMFRILKFLHFAREQGYPDIPVEKAAADFLARMQPYRNGQNHPKNLNGLLTTFRQIDRSVAVDHMNR